MQILLHRPHLVIENLALTLSYLLHRQLHPLTVSPTRLLQRHLLRLGLAVESL